MSVLCLIQARLNSTRFPGKILADLHGRPVIAHVLARVRAIRGVDRIVVAVPDAATVAELAAVGIESEYVEGVAEMDVLGRFAGIAARYPQHDTVMRLTADCPLLNPLIAEAVLALHQATRCTYASNVTQGYVDGEDVEVFSADALRAAQLAATSAHSREHVTVLIRHLGPTATLSPGSIKTSIDRPEDVEIVRRLLGVVVE
jgi:spore coat polysaccharide biosynthesis protein SpsF